MFKKLITKTSQGSETETKLTAKKTLEWDGNFEAMATTKPSKPNEKPRRATLAMLVWDEKFLVESVHKRRGETYKSAIDLFDFEKHWSRVLPHLHHPEVEAALVKEGFDLAVGPWSSAQDEYWREEITSRACAAIDQGKA